MSGALARWRIVRTTSNTVSDELTIGEPQDSTTTSFMEDKAAGHSGFYRVEEIRSPAKVHLEEPLTVIARMLGDFLQLHQGPCWTANGAEKMAKDP